VKEKREKAPPFLKRTLNPKCNQDLWDWKSREWKTRRKEDPTGRKRSEWTSHAKLRGAERPFGSLGQKKGIGERSPLIGGFSPLEKMHGSLGLSPSPFPISHPSKRRFSYREAESGFDEF